MEGRDQTGRAVKTRPGAWEAEPQGRAGRQQGHTCRMAMSGAARSQRGSRWKEHSNRGWMDGEKAGGGEKACRDGHKIRALGEGKQSPAEGSSPQKGWT